MCLRESYVFQVGGGGDKQPVYETETFHMPLALQILLPECRDPDSG
jgi:hypothetical protein